MVSWRHETTDCARRGVDHCAPQDEIRRTEESRYDHRLHGVLLVAHGMNCPEVARLLGDAPRTVEYWIRRFETHGLTGLAEGAQSGRLRRLSADHLAKIERVLRQPPREAAFAAVYGMAKRSRRGSITRGRSISGCGNVSACSANWGFACASRARWWPRPT